MSENWIGLNTILPWANNPSKWREYQGYVDDPAIAEYLADFEQSGGHLAHQNWGRLGSNVLTTFLRTGGSFGAAYHELKTGFLGNVMPLDYAGIYSPIDRIPNSEMVRIFNQPVFPTLGGDPEALIAANF